MIEQLTVLLQVDIFHPLTILTRGNYGGIVCDDEKFVQCVSLYGKVFVANTGRRPKLHVWSPNPAPGDKPMFDLPCTFCALATYNSKLVLVGGRERSMEKSVTGTLLVSGDEGESWEPSLPPMPTKRCEASAVSTRAPECLIVVGGEGENSYTDAVEVLRENQWSTVQSLPKFGHNIRSIIHNGNLYVTSEGYRFIRYCKLELLLSSSNNDSTVWRELEGPGTPISSCTSLGKQLLVFGQQTLCCRDYQQDIRIFTHSPHTQSWVAVQDMLRYVHCCASVTLPSGKIMAIVRNDWLEYIFLELSLRSETIIILIVRALKMISYHYFQCPCMTLTVGSVGVFSQD